MVTPLSAVRTISVLGVAIVVPLFGKRITDPTCVALGSTGEDVDAPGDFRKSVRRGFQVPKPTQISDNMVEFKGVISELCSSRPCDRSGWRVHVVQLMNRVESRGCVQKMSANGYANGTLRFRQVNARRHGSLD